MKQFKAYEFEQYNTRSRIDGRKKVDRYIVSYEDKEGFEYRKSYEFPVGTPGNDARKAIPKEVK